MIRIAYRYAIQSGVMRDVDVLVLLGLVRQQPDGWTVRSLAAVLHLPQAAVQRSLARLAETPVYDARRRRLVLSVADEFFSHALPFVAPARLGAPTRGVVTAWAAPPLVDALAPFEDLPPVWPDPLGQVRGLEVVPLHGAAVSLALDDLWMYEMLALVDGVRLGDARVRGLAREMVSERLAAGAPA